MTKIIHCITLPDLQKKLDDEVKRYPEHQIFLLCDTHTGISCLPSLQNTETVCHAHLLEIPSGDENKNYKETTKIWMSLSDLGATRKALLINLGGGMVTDIGGFAAATFKRGIDFINIPTTILSCVDAALGGKTGINFNGLKNEIGAFAPAESVFIYTPFFQTLDHANRISGYAEMLKHGLLCDIEHWNKVLTTDPDNPADPDFSKLIIRSMSVKENIVHQDPTEKSLRKALNLGHTVGHAFESLSYDQNRPILHGYAVAWGLICELYLSVKLMKFPTDALQECINRIRELYGIFAIQCKEYPLLLEKMKHDKKNTDEHIRFTLLSDIGKIKIDCPVEEKLIEESFDFYRDSMGI